MSVARDVVRRRIDPGGTKEITVITEGGNRILVEVPGVEDPEALKQLIGQTARLEFKLVDLSANPHDVAAGPRAAGQPGAADGRRHRLHGGQAPGDGFGRPADRRQRRASTRTAGRTSTSPSTPPARAASAASTQENVGKPFAIILDDKILSAPNINEPILGGQRADQRQLHRPERATTSPSASPRASCR